MRVNKSLLLPSHVGVFLQVCAKGDARQVGSFNTNFEQVEQIFGSSEMWVSNTTFICLNGGLVCMRIV
jgi:hypothetical protein